MLRTLTLAACISFASFGLAGAETITLGDITVTDQWVREAPKMAKAGAGYMTITNTGSQPDMLVSVKADFPKVMIHGTKNDNGVMKMFHVDGLDIPAGETVALAPGGYHIMFMGLGADGLKAGDTLSVTLVFEHAGSHNITFPIRPIQ